MSESVVGLAEYEAMIAHYERRLAEDTDLRLFVEQKVTDMFEANRKTLGCHDCGLCYGDDGWIECMVPDDVWRAIGYTGDASGILCMTCIARRAKRAGLRDVPVMLCGSEALRVADQGEAFDRGWNAAKQRIAELERLIGERGEARP